jgi:hypothetical protein
MGVREKRITFPLFIIHRIYKNTFHFLSVRALPADRLVFGQLELLQFWMGIMDHSG